MTPPWICTDHNCSCEFNPECVAAWNACYRCPHGHAPEHDLLEVYPPEEPS